MRIWLRARGDHAHARATFARLARRSRVAFTCPGSRYGSSNVRRTLATLATLATVLLCTVLTWGIDAAPSASPAPCTAAEKRAGAAAATAYARRMPAERRAYFRRVKSAKQRATFVRKQRQRLASLRAAAACVVTPLPPSSSESCDFELAPNAAAIAAGRHGSWPSRSFGPVDPESAIRTRGRVEAVMVFVDFPNAPANVDAAARASLYTEHLPWLEEASHGRFSLRMTVVPRWFRMPKAGTEYGSVQVNADRYLADVIAAIGGAVDFTRYEVVWVVPSTNASPGLGVHYVRYPGRGVKVPGGEVRFGVLMDAIPRGSESAHVLHRFLALLGGVLVDSSPKPFGSWDPGWAVGAARGEPFRTVHPIVWHKWMFRWIDPDQITCLRDAGQLEETLTPNAQAGGKKMVVVPTGASTAYVLEVRRRLGYDRSICRDGVLLYTVDSQLRGDQGAIEGKSSGPGCSPDATPFSVGQIYDDSVVKVEVLATDGSAYRVRVTRK